MSISNTDKCDLHSNILLLKLLSVPCQCYARCLCLCRCFIAGSVSASLIVVLFSYIKQRFCASPVPPPTQFKFYTHSLAHSHTGGIVNNTLRPTIPGYCDIEWRTLMEQCWATNPAVRPSFTEIARRLRVMSAAAIQTKGQGHKASK
jgi:hypothetical protein